MATVIDSLVVSLGLDASQFEKGQKQTQASLKATQDAASRTAKAMEADGTRAASFFAKVKNEVLGLTGALVGVTAGADEFAHAMAQMALSMTRIAQSAGVIGMKVPDLVALGNAIERNGGSAAGLESSLASIAGHMQTLRTFGNDPISMFLNPIGVGANATPEQVLFGFQRFIGAHAGDKNAANADLLEGQGLGIDSQTILAMVQIGTMANLLKELKESHDLGLPPGDSPGKFEKLNHALTALEQAAHNDVVVLEATLAPALTDFAKTLTDIVKDASPLVTALAGIAAAAGGGAGAAVALKKLSGWLFGAGGAAAGAEAAEAASGPVGWATIIGTLIAGALIDHLSQNGTFENAWDGFKSWLHGGSGSPPPTGPAYVSKLSSDERAANAERIRQFFLAQGFTPGAAEGVVVNAGAESNFDPHAVSPNGAVSVFQFLGDRKAAFEKLYGSDPSKWTVADNLAFAASEGASSKRDVWNTTRGITDPAVATREWALGYEVAGRAAAANRATHMSTYAPHITNTITVHGAKDPDGTAKAVGDAVQKAMKQSMVINYNRGLA